MSAEKVLRRLCREPMCDSEAVAVLYLRNGGGAHVRTDHLSLPPTHIVDPVNNARCMDHLLAAIEENVEEAHAKRVDHWWNQEADRLRVSATEHPLP